MDRTVLILVLGFVCSALAGDYNYRANDTVNGPSNWNTKWATDCGNGKRQSPIDIKTQDTKLDSKIGALKFTNIDTIPSDASMQVGNNKYGLRVYVKPNFFTVEDGGLPGKFTMLSFHLHWGSDATKGSEHTVDGKKYPAELHFVHFNSKYGNVSNALDKVDGLAAIGVFLEIGASNAALESFIAYCKDIITPKELYNNTQRHKLSDLMPSDRSAFYRYNGSLTTPSCKETVTWTVFNKTMTITEAQLIELRALKDSSSNGYRLLDTFRDVQPLKDRTVFRTFGMPNDEMTTKQTPMAPTASGVRLSPLFFLSFLLVALNILNN